jgi:RNA polymerase sigma-70 factor (ECF subfamily)
MESRERSPSSDRGAQGWAPSLFSFNYPRVDFEQALGDAAVMNMQSIPSEDALIASARMGSRKAFAELVRRHSNRVYGMSFKMLKNREDAEDNLQNVFCKAYGKIRQFKGNSQFSTRLMRIVINEALMALRKRQSRNAVVRADGDRPTDDLATETQLRDLHPDPERQYLTKELAAKAFAALSPALRNPFILQKGEGWTCQEVADALDIATATVKSRIFRARVRLRRQLLALSKTQPIALQSSIG